MKKILFLFTLATIFIGCGSSDTTETISINNKYSVDLPSFLTSATDLNEDASLQYQNLFKEFYTIVIDESSDEFNDVIEENGLQELYAADLSGYAQLISDVFIDGLEVYNETDYQETNFSGLPAKTKEIEGSIAGIDVYYNLSVVQGKADYYQILSWTLLNKKNDHKGKMNSISSSFKEL